MQVAPRTIFEIGAETLPDHEPVFRGQMARMTYSPFLEAFTKVHPIVPGLIFVPVVAYFAWLGFTVQGLTVLAAVAVGLFIWTITEYTLHRFLFHVPVRGPVSQLIYLTFHGVHHMYPDDKMRLVMVPAVSVPLAFLFYGLFGLTLPAGWEHGAFAGMAMGYLTYDYSHWSTHWVKPPKHPLLAPVRSILQTQRDRHMTHHFGDHDKGFGVSTGFWDVIFRTVDPKRQKK